MDNLGVLLEYQVEITVKLEKAFDSLQKWFENKSEKVKDMFEEGKRKLTEGLEKLSNKYKNMAGIVDVDIEASKYNTKTLKSIKGRMSVSDFVKEVSYLFKELLELFRSDCMTVIELCKYALHELTNLRARRKDRVELTTAYSKLSKSKKKLTVKFSQVETGTEVINKTLTKIRGVKAETRREMKDEKKYLKSQLKADRDMMIMTTGDRTASNIEYKYNKYKLDSSYKNVKDNFR